MTISCRRRKMAKAEAFQPGEILILPSVSGHWFSAWEFVELDAESGGHFARCRDLTGECGMCNIAASALKRPHVTGVTEQVIRDAGEGSKTREPTTTRTRRPKASRTNVAKSKRVKAPSPALPMTDAQRRRIFAMAQGIGLDLDGIRALTPMGSVSALSKVEAHGLIERLAGRSHYLNGQGTATAKQLNMIAHMRDANGFTAVGFSSWLLKRFGVGSIDEIEAGGLASNVIGGLIRMHGNRSLPAVNGSPDQRRHRGGSVETGFDPR